MVAEEFKTPSDREAIDNLLELVLKSFVFTANEA